VTSHRHWLTLPLLCCWALAGTTRAFAMLPPAHLDDAPITIDETQDGVRLAQIQPAPTPSPIPAASPTPAPAAQPAAGDEPIGNVASLTGTVTVIRNKDSIALKLKDDIYLNDTVQTSAGASLGVTFSDDTTFHLSANAKITIDTYVYDPAGKQNKGVFDVGRGTVAFVAAAVAKTGDMQITTPTASLGIRGTTGVVEVPEGGAAGGSANNIKLYPDADGRVGRIEVSDRQGQRLGSLTQGASGFAVRPGTGGARATAAPLTISPQQAARDQGIVRQVHATQSVGRQIVTEQRAIRRANPPAGNQNRGNQPPRQPGQQQSPGQKQPPGQKQLPGQQKQQSAPKRQGSQQGGPQQGLPGQGGRTGQTGQPGERAGQNAKPGEPGQQGQPQRSGQTPAEREQRQPQRPGQTPPQPPAGAAPPAPAAQPRQGGVPGAPNFQRPPAPKPALQRPKPPPAGKKEKKR